MDVIIVVIKKKLNEKIKFKDWRGILHEAIKFNWEKLQALLSAFFKLITLKLNKKLK